MPAGSLPVHRRDLDLLGLEQMNHVRFDPAPLLFPLEKQARVALLHRNAVDDAARRLGGVQGKRRWGGRFQVANPGRIADLLGAEDCGTGNVPRGMDGELRIAHVPGSDRYGCKIEELYLVGMFPGQAPANGSSFPGLGFESGKTNT